MPLECSRYSPFIIVEKISQAERDSLTIGQLGISRGGPPIERAVSAPDVGIGSGAAVPAASPDRPPILES
jgi:hypothetical protein